MLTRRLECNQNFPRIDGFQISIAFTTKVPGTFLHTSVYGMMKYIFQSCICLIAGISVCNSLQFYTSINYEYDDKHVTPTPGIGRMHVDHEMGGVIKPTVNHTATVIFLHQMGKVGIQLPKEYVDLISNFKSAGIKAIFPTAPLRPVTAFKNKMQNPLYYVWFDATEMSYKSKELLHTCEQNYKDLKALIQTEYEAGIPLNKIFVGGSQQGGMMAMHIALRIVPEIRGVFVLDSYLFENSIVFKELREKTHKKLPELLWIHSKTDAEYTIAKNQAEDLKKLGVSTQFVAQNPNKKGINPEVLNVLWAWLKSKLISQ